MPNNYLSVLYKHIIRVENKNVGLKVGWGDTNIPLSSLPNQKRVVAHAPALPAPPPPPPPTPLPTPVHNFQYNRNLHLLIIKTIYNYFKFGNMHHVSVGQSGGTGSVSVTLCQVLALCVFTPCHSRVFG